MVVSACYVGYGVDMTIDEIINIFELDEKLFEKKNNKSRENENNSDESDYDDEDSEDDDESYYDIFDLLRKQFESKKICISGKQIKIIYYPHDCDKNDEKKYAVGFWTFIHIENGVCGKKLEKELLNLFSNKFDTKSFKEMIGKKCSLMTIADDCQCCS